MTDQPKVSVIIPVYNAEKYLEQCLDSVVSQTLKDIEIICVDDGSTDRSLNILNDYARKDDRIRVISQKNINAGAARNNGLQYAKGEYLSFLDADDFFETDMLETAYTQATAEKADIVVFRCDHYYEDSHTFEPVKWSMRGELLPDCSPFSAKDIAQNIFSVFVGWPWDKLFSSKFITDNGLKFQEQRTTNDMLFVFAAIAKAERICTLDNIFAHHRKKTGTSLSVTREKSWDCFYNALTALKAQLKEWDLFSHYERDYVNYCLHASLWNLNSLKWPVQEVLFYMLKTRWFEEFGLSNRKADYFYNKNEYNQMQRIMTNPYEMVYDGRKENTAPPPPPAITEKPTAPKVSIVMPSLNVAPYIRECIESVLNQTLQNIEIISVDAGSTDGTLEILQEYAKRDARITLLHSDKRSYGYQVNLGFKAAKGQYFAIVETDDYIVPDMYEYLVGLADENQLDLIKSDFCKFIGDGAERDFTHFDIAPFSDLYDKVIDPTEDWNAFRAPLYTWAGIYCSQFLKDNNILHNETPGASYQDNGFWFQTFCQARRIMFSHKECYMLRRDNPNSSFFSKAKVYCMCEEYDFIRNILRKDPALERKFAPLCARFRHNNYNWTLERVADEHKLEFVYRFAADFKKILADGELLQSQFTEQQWRRLFNIMEDPEYFYYHNVFKGDSTRYPIDILEPHEQILALKKWLALTDKKLDQNKKQLRTLKEVKDAEISKIKKTYEAKVRKSYEAKLKAFSTSNSWRIGRLITWLPRKVKGGINCCRDHGLKYTIKRVIKKMIGQA